MSSKFIEIRTIKGKLYGIYEEIETDLYGLVKKKQLVAVPIQTQGEIEAEELTRDSVKQEYVRRLKKGG